MIGVHAQHDHVPEPGPLLENPIWQQDNIDLASIGIDIGTAITQVVLSTIRMRRASEDLVANYEIVAREVVHQSPLEFTPYLDDGSLAVDELISLLERAVAATPIGKRLFDTGVVLLTGEAQAGENARIVAEQIAERFDSMLCISAGHKMEAALAAHGSGAISRSRASDSSIVNLDMGGATTKLSVVARGAVVTSAAVHVGARLLTFDESGRIDRYSEAGRAHLMSAGLPFDPNHRYQPDELAALAKAMVGEVASALGPFDDRPSAFLLTSPLSDANPHSIMFSGGVAEYAYGRETRNFGDLGPYLGRALRDWVSNDTTALRLLPPGECIRATALGAAQDTVQLSGTTVFVSSPSLLPRRNLQVIRPRLRQIDAASIAGAIHQEFESLGLDGTEPDVALAFIWDAGPEYNGMAELAKGIAASAHERFSMGLGSYILIDVDCGMTLGRIMKKELDVPAEIVVLDGLKNLDFSWVDISEPREGSGAVPVTIKSLVFDSMRGGPSTMEREIR